VRTAFALLAATVLALACGDGEPIPGSTPPTGEAVLTFSAGGSIYTVASDGSGLAEVIAGDRQEDVNTVPALSPTWNAAPAFSPDGTRLAFTRNLDIWIADADGGNARLLADVGNYTAPPGGGADNFSPGVQSIAWSPDSKHIAYVMSRIGGSGIQDVWVMRADGTEGRRLYGGGSSWNAASWLDDERIAVYEPPGRVLVLVAGGEKEPVIMLPAEERYALTALAAPNGRWLVGPITTEGPIMYGAADALSQVAIGLSPALSPDGRTFAYFTEETLHVASIDGSQDRELVDLSRLGGRDRFFGEHPACFFPEESPACSYRVPMISWAGPDVLVKQEAHTHARP